MTPFSKIIIYYLDSFMSGLTKIKNKKVSFTIGHYQILKTIARHKAVRYLS